MRLIAPMSLSLVMWLIAAVTLDALARPCLAQEAPIESIEMREALVIDPVGEARRSAIHTDAIEQQIVEGKWTRPTVGASILKPDGVAVAWSARSVDADAWLGHRGYVCWTVRLEAEAIMLLDAAGHSLVYVNGQLRPGDPYEYGNLSLPVSLRAGESELLFYVARGRMRAKLTPCKAGAFFDLRDATLPDLLRGAGANQSGPVMGGLVVVNPSPREWLGAVTVGSEAGQAATTRVGPIPPLSLRKVAVEFPIPGMLDGLDKVNYSVFLTNGGDFDAPRIDYDKMTLTLNVRDSGDHHTRTFISAIDGSVQKFTVRPSSTAGDGQALFLSLHGAGVDAPGQSGSYAAKDWGHVVAPTNRRPFGFDWEDWGRMDAMEVLAEATRIYAPDPNRIYLTGHSMGGHGTWQIGAHYPDRFAAIGPSAGWVSFWSYTGASDFDEAHPVGRIMARATLPSDTLALSRNFLQQGIYILHGDADDNVPVEQAQTMRAHLSGYHADFAYYERPGAGHWWGSACLDWPPMFDFFRHHVRPAPQQVRRIEFVTANPSVSSRSQWITVEQQMRSLVRSSVVVDFDPGKRRLTGATENIRTLAIDVGMLADSLRNDAGDSSLTIVLDGSEMACDVASATGGVVRLRREEEAWRLLSERIEPKEKHPRRAGPFKEAFHNRMIFVYGTQGTVAENAWALAKARSDAEAFFYRGNGSIDVMDDLTFNLFDHAGRNVILYGNADTNAAWTRLLTDGPINLERGRVRFGERVVEGDNLACLFTYPNAMDDDSLVAVVGGTGLIGCRLTDRFTYFVSGVHYPDWFIARPQTLRSGIDAVVGAGFFDHAWRIDAESSGWSE